MATRTAKKPPRKKAVKPNRFIAIDCCNERYTEFDDRDELDDRLGNWIEQECCNSDDVRVFELVQVVEYSVEVAGVKLTKLNC